MPIDYHRSTHIQGKVRQGLTNLTGKDMRTLLDLDSFFIHKGKGRLAKGASSPQSLSHTQKKYGTEIEGAVKTQ